jgi:opacity protein-like surface antigen
VTSTGVRTLTLVVAFSILVTATPAMAQTQARVVRSDAVIWRLDVSIPVGTVKFGTMLTVAGTAGDFFEVVIPVELGGHGETGRIARTSVEVIGRPVGTRPQAGQPNAVTRRRPTIRRSILDPKVGLRGFGQAGVAFPSARDSFKTITGRWYGFAFGGGAQARFRNGLFVEASFDHLRKTGERVVLFDGTVFPLGIRDTITIQPLMFSSGYRFSRTRTTVPYLGGGIGAFQLTERTPFSDASEVVRERHIGYRVLGGVEFRNGRWFGTAIEAAYTYVPDSLGIGGVSQVFGEHDLGGLDVKLKVLLGR